MEEEEFLALYDEYHNMVYRLALSITASPQDAEDIVQTVFLKMLSSPPAPGSEKAWLIKVTVNASRDLLRSAWRRKTEPLDEALTFETPEESGLFDAVMALPPKLRVLIHLYYYEGYSYAEIAKILKLSSSAVSMRLHRARQLLRSSLKEEYNEEFISKDL